MKKYYDIVVVLLIFIVLFFSVGDFHDKADNNNWNKNALTPFPFGLDKLKQKFDLESDTVVVSAKELAFVFNAMTGTKTLTSRWAQENNQFIDFSNNDLVTAILLYGNNTKVKEDIIQYYNIDYLYWDLNWVRVEFQIDNNGKVIGKIDPLIMLYSNDREQRLRDNGVKYIRFNTYIDPSSNDKYTPVYDLLIVSLENYRSLKKPWNSNLDNYIEEVWNYTENGNKISILYKFKN